MLYIVHKILLPVLLAVLSLSIGYSQTYSSGDWTYSLNGASEATVTGYSGAGGAVTIPSSINGNPVKRVGSGSSIFGFGNTTVTSVVIPDSVTSIGPWAFSGCTALTSVTIGSGVTSIGDGAFRNCPSLTGIDVDQANPAFTSVSGVLFDKALTTLITCPAKEAGVFTIPDSVTSIAQWAFEGGTGLTGVVIPDSVTSIGRGAFAVCTALTSVTIGSGVTSIADLAFYYSAALTNVTIGSGVRSIGSETFGGCTSLTSITIPASVTSIELRAFNNCPSLTGIDVDQANPAFTSVSGVLFDKALTTLITCPAKEAGVFTIPDSVTSIADGAFAYCAELTSVVIPDSVTSIGVEAFLYCTALTSVTIGSGVTSIEHSAFRESGSLRELYFSGNAPSVGWDLFSGISPSGIVYYMIGTTGWGLTFGGWPTRVFGADANLDADGDGLNDVAEMSMSALGFDWEIAQPDLVAALYSNANLAKLYSETQYNANRTNGQTDVTTNPSAFNLFTQEEYGASYDNGVSAGIGIILSNPSAYNLYTSNSIMDLRMNGLMVPTQNGVASVSIQPVTTTNLLQPFTNNGAPIVFEVPMPANQAFMRIDASAATAPSPAK